MEGRDISVKRNRQRALKQPSGSTLKYVKMHIGYKTEKVGSVHHSGP